MTPSTTPDVPLQAVMVAFAFILFGYLIVDAFFNRTLSAATKWGLAVPGFVLYVFVLMLAHIAMRGALLSEGGLVRVLTALTAGALAVLKVVRLRKESQRSRAYGQVVIVCMLLFVALLIWAYPLGHTVPLHFTPDTKRHMGMAHQLLNGETTPSIGLVGDIPNYYPWLYHAVVAFLSHFSPDKFPLFALAPLHVMAVSGSILLLFALGRSLSDNAWGGFAAALFGGLTGGFAYVLTTEPNLILNPRTNALLEYFGDLLFVRSYNFAFSNLPPAFPRDLSYLFLLGQLLLAVEGLKEWRIRILICEGVALGLAGLCGGEAFLVGMAVACLLSVMAERGRRVRTFLATAGVGVAIYAVWLVPLMVGYFRLGGFRSLAASPVDLPVWAIVFSWGIITPFAIYGVTRLVARIREKPTRVIVALLIATSTLLLVSALVELLPGQGFDTLGRRHRYWPLLSLTMVLIAATGAADLLSRLGSRKRLYAYGLSGAIVLAAVPSTVLASLAYPDVVLAPPLLERTMLQDEPTVLDAIQPPEGQTCVVAVPDDIRVAAFAHTGNRFIDYNVTPGGRAYVRWKRIDRQVPYLRRRVADNELLTSGTGQPGRWLQTARRYGVDIVVAPASVADAPAFAGREARLYSGPEGEWIVVRLSSC